MKNNDNSENFFSNAYNLRDGEETKQFYADWAASYDREIGVEGGYRQPERCGLALANAIEDKSAAILDIGCGTGLSGLALRAAGFKNIDGCDFSPQMLEKAQQAQCYRRLFEADLNASPIAIDKGSYAGITAVGIFSFGHVMPDAINEFLRILSPGGVFVIGLNDHYYEEGAFPKKLDELAENGLITVLSKEHGAHLENVEGSTGWVIACEKVG